MIDCITCAEVFGNGKKNNQKQHRGNRSKHHKEQLNHTKTDDATYPNRKGRNRVATVESRDDYACHPQNLQISCTDCRSQSDVKECRNPDLLSHTLNASTQGSIQLNRMNITCQEAQDTEISTSSKEGMISVSTSFLVSTIPTYVVPKAPDSTLSFLSPVIALLGGDRFIQGKNEAEINSKSDIENSNNFHNDPMENLIRNDGMRIDDLLSDLVEQLHTRNGESSSNPRHLHGDLLKPKFVARFGLRTGQHTEQKHNSRTGLLVQQKSAKSIRPTKQQTTTDKQQIKFKRTQSERLSWVSKRKDKLYEC